MGMDPILFDSSRIFKSPLLKHYLHLNTPFAKVHIPERFKNNLKPAI